MNFNNFDPAFTKTDSEKKVDRLKKRAGDNHYLFNKFRNEHQRGVIEHGLTGRPEPTVAQDEHALSKIPEMRAEIITEINKIRSQEKIRGTIARLKDGVFAIF